MGAVAVQRAEFVSPCSSQQMYDEGDCQRAEPCHCQRRRWIDLLASEKLIPREVAAARGLQHANFDNLARRIAYDVVRLARLEAHEPDSRAAHRSCSGGGEGPSHHRRWWLRDRVALPPVELQAMPITPFRASGISSTRPSTGAAITRPGRMLLWPACTSFSVIVLDLSARLHIDPTVPHDWDQYFQFGPPGSDQRERSSYTNCIFIVILTHDVTNGKNECF